jgi:hypothetical protein
MASAGAKPPTRLMSACVEVPIADLHTALGKLGCTTLTHVLAYGSTFLEGELSPDEVEELRNDLCRKAADQAAGSTLACGESSMPWNTVGLRHTRVLIIACRTLFKRENATGEAEAAVLNADPATIAAAEAKPLSAKVLEQHWLAAETVTGGFSIVEPHYRLAPPLVSKMVAANKHGGLTIPQIDSNYSYSEPSANKLITTILKGANQLNGDNTEIQLVQGSQAADRRDRLDIVSDYSASIRHRSCALLVGYCTPEASMAYMGSARYLLLSRHERNVITGTTKECQITPASISLLERRLVKAMREGYTAAQMVQIDSQVIRAVLERAATVNQDGNKAIEYVCDQCTSLFRPAQVQFDTDTVSETSGPSSSSAAKEDMRELTRVREQNRNLTSQRDRANNQLTRMGSSPRRVDSRPDERRDERTDTRRRDDQRICNDYNRGTCSRGKECRFAHVCNRTAANGTECRNARHTALNH